MQVLFDQAVRQALPVGDVDLEMLPVAALPAIVVAGKEVGRAFFQQRHRHRHVVAGVLRLPRGPLDRVIDLGVVVVAALVGSRIVRLHDGVVLVRVENCSVIKTHQLTDRDNI